MRRGEQARAPARRAQDGRQHRRHRTLAVGARDVQRRGGELGMAERGHPRVHAVDAEGHAARLEREEPLAHGGVVRRRPDRPLAASRRHARLSPDATQAATA